MTVRRCARNALVHFVTKATPDPCYLFTPDDICRLVDDDDMEDKFFYLLFEVFALNKDFTYQEVVNGLVNMIMQPEGSNA